MTSPQLSKETKMGIKSLVGKKMSRKVKFMGEDVTISKLTVSEVLEIQEHAKGLTDNDAEGFNILKKVIAMAVEGGEDLKDEDFNAFPMDELSKLSAEIMKFSGVGGGEGK